MQTEATETTGEAGAVYAQRQMKRVLLTNAYGPYPNKWGKAVNDLLGARLARENNMDGRARMFSWPLYIIAENLTNPCTVLECPLWNDFIEEVKKGYDVVAIQLISMHMAHVARMMKAVRELSPRSQIVIGGYGVGMLHQPLPGDKEGNAVYIRENADHICRGEGVHYMRELLHDEPVDRPITQYDLPPTRIQLTRLDRIQFDIPIILVSLGCPSACEFCNTSAFFHYKKIRVADAAQVYDFMKEHQRRTGMEAMTFILFDEDIFMDPEFVRELGRLIRSDPKTWGFRWISFGSINTVSRFHPRELRECGVEAIWIGVESGITDEKNASKTGYRKREGETSPEQLFPELTRHGIQIIGSMILGFDFHTPENIEKDIDYFVSLKPTLYQIGPFRPCPGTKLYDRMLKQERINDVFEWEDIHLWEVGSFKLKNLGDRELKHYFDLAHQKMRNINGPPLLQIFEANIQAYHALKDDPSEFLRYQAERSRDLVRRFRPVAKAIELKAPTPAVKQRARELLRQAEPLLVHDSLMPVRNVIRAVSPHVVNELGIICTYQPEMETRRQVASSPPTRWTYFHTREENGPVVREKTGDGNGSLLGDLSRLREIGINPRNPARLLRQAVRSFATGSPLRN
jgi:haloalkane dehalogenase